MGDSLFFYENDKTDKMFENLINVINITKQKVDKEISDLKCQLEIVPKLNLDTLHIQGTKVSTWDRNSYYTSNKVIRIDITSDCRKELGVSETYLFYQITEEGVKSAKDMINKIAELDKEKHLGNISKSESNTKTLKALMDLLKRVGLSETYYGYKSTRSSKKESLSYNWMSEISSQFQRSYSSNLLQDSVTKLHQQIQKIYDDELKKKKEEEAKKEKEKSEKEQNKKLALLLAKYDLSLENEWEDLLNIVINKDKYLYLAYYLERNRGDWNDGCSYAETGIDRFMIESDVDQEIYNDISHYIENWSDYMDGRCFRDCNYSYSVLYGMVEKDLYKDFQIIRENVSDF